jgi:hypothetical protein
LLNEIAWEFFTLKARWFAFLVDEGVDYFYDGNNWARYILSASGIFNFGTIAAGATATQALNVPRATTLMAVVLC